MLQTLVVWLLSALALYATAFIVPGFAFSGFGVAMVAALILGLLNALLRPILMILALPINILTLGLFTFVINGILLGFAAFALDGFVISGILPAVFGAVVLALINAALHFVFDGRESAR